MSEETLWDGLVIRPSMSSGYPDCNLRGLGRAYPFLFERLGIKLRQIEPSIAAAVGTGVHSGATHSLLRKQGMGDIGSEEEAISVALESLHKEVDGGTCPDDITPTVNVAEQQVARMTKTFRAYSAPGIQPIKVEQRFDGNIGDGFVLSGQADWVAMNPNGIDDLKTGAVDRMHVPQLGCYSLVYRTHGYVIDSLRHTFIQRVTLKKEQPQPVTVIYDAPFAEQVAQARINQIKNDVKILCETGNPILIQANPASMLCSDRWCPLHGTRACRQHKGAS